MISSVHFYLVNCSVTLLLWSVALVFVRARLLGQNDEVVSRASVFVLFFALTVTFSTPGVYLATERLVDVNNLAWLLSYLSLTTALYAAVATSYSMIEQPLPFWATPLYSLTVILLSLLFVTGITQQSVYMEHTLARSLHELAFMTVMYTYAIWTGSVPARVFRRFAQYETSLYLRLRMSAVALAAGAGVSCMVWKLLYTLAGYIWPTLWFLKPLWLLNWLFFILAGLFLVVACLPNAFFRRLASVSQWRRDVWALYELRFLRSRLEEFCPPIVKVSPSWREWVRDPHYYLYGTVIYLFDCQQLLERHHDHPQARRLHDALRTLPSDTESFEIILESSLQINREIKRHMKGRLANQLVAQLARWISTVIHPFTLVVPTLVLVAWLASTPFWAALGWTLLSIPVAILPPFLFLVFHVSRGQVSDWDVSIREQRHGMYIVALASISLLLLVFVGFGAPRVLQACLFAALAAYGVGSLINQAGMKISIHATAAAGSAAVLFYVAPTVGLVAALAALAAGWSRVYLRRHTVLQVVAGWLVAVLCVSLVFPLVL